MNRGLLVAAILVITALSFFVFPGHTYLQQDTQIYVPILENQWSGALGGDLIVEHPHVNFTLYDELTNSLRRITDAPLRYVLESEQFVFRALGVFGLYLVAVSFGVHSGMALIVTAIVSLGAAIKGPEVLTIEYEPTPRSFAVPLLLLAVGLALHKRYWWAGVAAGCAFLLHAPTTWPFWLVYFALILVHRRAAVAVVPLAVAVGLLLAIGFTQPVGEHQRFFERLPAALERLQRLRASYNYVSTWWLHWMPQYLLFAALAATSFLRIRARRDHWVLVGGLALCGLLSVPASYLFLEQAHLALIPQLQPARALLFVTLAAVLGAAMAGCQAAEQKQWLESAAWFAFALWVPAQVEFFAWPGWRAAATVLALALLLAWLIETKSQYRVSVAISIPLTFALFGGVVNYRKIETGDLALLAQWARSQPPGVYAFPEAGHDRAPGWFRAMSLQPVYVDWKGGGQVNFLLLFGAEWWRRWQAVMTSPVDFDHYAQEHIDYVVLPRPIDGAAPLFRSNTWFVYSVASSQSPHP